MLTQDERLTQQGYEPCPNCGLAFNAHSGWIAHPGDTTCIEVAWEDEEDEEEAGQEEPPEEMWCAYHQLYHWPCF